MTIKVRPTAIEEGSRQNVDQVTQMRSDVRSSARPALFGHLTDLCISVIWSGPEGARGNNGRGPGTTVNPVNTQFSDLGRLSWPKRAEINACLNFPPFLDFCHSEK